MLNFSIGPVQINKEIRLLAQKQIPYFRTSEFSIIMKDNERLMKNLTGAEDGARTVFITGSGTASMEASVMNIFSPQDKVIVVNGGSFGQRFAILCKIHNIPYTEIKLNIGEQLTAQHLDPYQNKNYTGFLVNMHETSTCILYNMNLISDFCRKNNLILLVDAISCFLAEPIDMKNMKIDALIIGSQKALALAPGLSCIVLQERLLKRIYNNSIKSLYFDLKIALKDGERGQTPFTPAVGILLQLNKRLKAISETGIYVEYERVKALSRHFRKKAENLPVKIPFSSISNAATPICPSNNISAYKIYELLKNEYDIFVCPNGGELKDKLFRVGHIGDITEKDNMELITALTDLARRKIL